MSQAPIKTTNGPPKKAQASKSTGIWTVLVAVFAILVAGVVKNSIQKEETVQEWNTQVHDENWEKGSSVCAIDRMHEKDLTEEIFLRDYWRKKPLILDREPQPKAKERTRKSALLGQNAETSIRLATFESYAKSQAERHDTLRQYLNDWKPVSSTSPANTSFAFGADPYDIGSVYIPPMVPKLTHRFQVALAAPGAGLAFHWHADVWAETLHGSRRWFLYPPEHSPVFNARSTSVEWLLNTYQEKDSHLHECTLHANMAIYVPTDWFHSTLSLGEAVSMTTSYAQVLRDDIRSTTETSRIDPATLTHAQMLDAFGESRYEQAIEHGVKLARMRPHSFVPHAWLAVIYTKAARHDAKRMQRLLHDGLSHASACTSLNGKYAPCWVWKARILEGLGMLQEDEKLLEEAKVALSNAAELTHDKDDEILDPRWQRK